MIRKAKISDIDDVAEIYEKIHTREDLGLITVGWIRDLYPTRQTALDSLRRDDLFVYEHEGKVIAAAIINKIQDESYVNAPWKYDAKDIEVCVIHTLVVDPKFNGKGIGVDFVKFYEEYAKEKGCSELRLDTNEKNLKARALYKNLGFEEIAIVPTTFNGIPDMNLVLLEKSLLG